MLAAVSGMKTGFLEPEITYEDALNALYQHVLESIKFYVSQRYKPTKSLDIYDIEQILHKIRLFDTEVLQLFRIKKELYADFENLSKIILNRHTQKVKEIENIYDKINVDMLKAEMLQKRMIISNILHFRWPFNAEYKKVCNKLKEMEYKRDRVKVQLNVVKNKRAVLEYSEVEEFINFIQKKYEMNL